MSNSKKKPLLTLFMLVLTIGLAVYNFYIKPKTSTKTINTGAALDLKKTTEGLTLLPTSTTRVLVAHDNYTLSYSEEHEQAEWVAYELKTAHLSRTKRKRPYFIRDKKIKTKSAHYKAYKNSGYDKGHLCPAGDRKFSKEAHDETFLTSNISPQKHSFNAGVWNRLEQKTRYWARKYNGLFVVTGGILEENLPHIGREQVSVPKQFYKILYDESNQKAIAFLVPSEDSDAPLYTFVTSIDKIEMATGIDFFYALPDDLEDKIEASADYKGWSF